MLYILCCEMQEKNRRFFSCISQHSMYNIIYLCSEEYGMIREIYLKKLKQVNW